MSDLLDRARKMALPDPYDERDDPNWMLLMRELIGRIEEQQERIGELERENKKFVETIVEIEFAYNKKTNEMIKHHADRLEELKQELVARTHNYDYWRQYAEALEQVREKVLKVLAGGIAGDGKPLSLDTSEERITAALAYMLAEEVVRVNPEPHLVHSEVLRRMNLESKGDKDE